VERRNDRTRLGAGEKATGLSCVSSVLRDLARQHHLNLGVELVYADLHRERSHSAP